jgi:hypothetical protein
MLNTMWSALLLICAIDANGEYLEPRQCSATVSQQVWKAEMDCMNAIAAGMNTQLKMPQPRTFLIRDFECHEWERQRFVTPEQGDSEL